MTNKLSAADRLRMQSRSGKVASVGAPKDEVEDPSSSSNAGGISTSFPAEPGVFEPRVASGFPEFAPHLVQAAAAQAVAVEGQETLKTEPAADARSFKMSALDRLRVQSSSASNSGVVRKEMAAMRTLTRLLEAIYTRPGSSASDDERMSALATLSTQAMDLGTVVARVAGEDADRSRYIRAMAMEAAVGLVCRSWETGAEVNWAKLIELSSDSSEISDAANAMAHAVYRPVVSQADVADRLTISAHSAFWQVYGLGESVNGMTPKVAAEIVRDCLKYLQERDKFIADNDMHVTWLQGSIRRLTDLVCAEMRARFADAQAPGEEDIRSVLAVARSGFEGVENYAQSILEKSGPDSAPRPVDQ